MGTIKVNEGLTVFGRVTTVEDSTTTYARRGFIIRRGEDNVAEDTGETLNMSVDFTFVLAGEFDDHDALERRLSEELSRSGYQPNPDVQSVAFDGKRDVFDETDLPPGDVSVCGWAREYFHEGTTIYVLVAGSRAQAVNAYVEISGRALQCLIDDDRLHVLLFPIGILADALHATGGFGTFDFPFSPIAPDAIGECILRTPEAPFAPALLAILGTSQMDHSAVRARFSAYDVKLWKREYWLLEHQDFREQ